MQWDGLYLLDATKKRTYWTMQGPFETNIASGLIAAGNMLIEEYSQLNGIEVSYRFALGTKRLQEQLIIENIEVLGDNYRHPPLLEEKVDKGRLPTDKQNMGIWVYAYKNKNKDEIYWKYIEARLMTKFLQGFISMSKAFQVDFRDYILELPIDSNGIKYDIPTYKLKEYLEEPAPDQEYKQDEEYGDYNEEESLENQDESLENQDEYADY